MPARWKQIATLALRCIAQSGFLLVKACSKIKQVCIMHVVVFISLKRSKTTMIIKKDCLTDTWNKKKFAVPFF